MTYADRFSTERRNLEGGPSVHALCRWSATPWLERAALPPMTAMASESSIALAELENVRKQTAEYIDQIAQSQRKREALTKELASLASEKQHLIEQSWKYQEERIRSQHQRDVAKVRLALVQTTVNTLKCKLEQTEESLNEIRLCKESSR